MTILEGIKGTQNIYATLAYEDGKWIAIGKNKRYNVAEIGSIHLAKTLYSLPSNDKHEPWTKTRTIGINIKNTELVSKVWSKYKPGMVVSGRIINNEFNII